MATDNTVNMARGEKTILTKANSASYSLRTTVPKGIASQFDLKPGGSLLWEIRSKPDGQGLIIVVIPQDGSSSKGAPVT
jgi:hypothetical protein